MKQESIFEHVQLSFLVLMLQSAEKHKEEKLNTQVHEA